ncbi:DUF4974 domain-containing protein [Chitinophaga sp. G-6-1-13]|uniref:DUF4974 domain-containing protein n=1 Tax=Chitinophaga fulva TaxID=2728842 RepID=A0A848GU16_9BACT|nr:FecR domain-containing protein [Chitinophaga fulva]NML40130.1 DUF4974 domain-containing protein [Chitinophaga fulva]
MEQFYLLLEKFKKGQAGAADIAQLETLMQQGADESMKAAMLKAYLQSIADKQQVLPPDKTAAMLDRLHAAIETEAVAPVRKRPLRTILLPLSVAASVLVMVGAVYLKYQLNTANRKAATAPMASHHISNNGSDIKSLALADGSIIHLAPNSTLTWKDSTVEMQRRLILQGKADFMVHADTKRPFTVEAAGITVTALGTTFTVNTTLEENKVAVKLSEGKVRIHTTDNNEDVYLLPGEEYAINTITRSFDIKKSGSLGKAPASTTPEVNNVVLSFNNEPLDQAIHTLGAHFKTKICFQQEDVSALYFTGKVLKKDSLKSILAAICAMNQLELRATGDSIIISK